MTPENGWCDFHRGDEAVPVHVSSIGLFDGSPNICASCARAALAFLEPAKRKRKPTEKAHELYHQAYERGIMAASGQPFALAKSHRGALIAMAQAHGKVGGVSLTGEALLQWFENTAAKYRKATAGTPQFQSGFSPEACLRWLNSGALSAPTSTLQQAECRAWKMPSGEDA